MLLHRLAAAAVTIALLAACGHAQALEHARPVGKLALKAVENPGVVELAPDGFDRVVALSDVHGMDAPLRALLRAAGLIDGAGAWTGGRTLLVIVGDSIDKGAHSLDVLDLWVALAASAPASGGRVVHVLGNHEAEFLADPLGDAKAAEFLAELAARHVSVAELLDPATPRGAFLAHEPLALKLGRWLFCHAGSYPDMPWPAFKASAAATLSARRYADPLLTNPEGILEGREWEKDPLARQALLARLAANGLAGVVHGHQPKAYGLKNRIGAVDGGKLIKLDSGMSPDAGANPGELLRFVHPQDFLGQAMPAGEIVGAGPLRPLVPEEAKPPKD
ncbi:MAG: hypothetical protein JWM80_535 [Cyanobacteria bacterium RYN_339]|nr:hypothetical protein [Cyanobacteria bacterium RYN_339]